MSVMKQLLHDYINLEYVKCIKAMGLCHSNIGQLVPHSFIQTKQVKKCMSHTCIMIAITNDWQQRKLKGDEYTAPRFLWLVD